MKRYNPQFVLNGTAGMDLKKVLEEKEEKSEKDLVLSALMEAKANLRAGKAAPDTTGADKVFIDGFITERMEYDFWVIARGFLKRYFQKHLEFDKTECYGYVDAHQSGPERLLQKRILSILYKEARSGDEYSKNMMKKLYQTYYKQEYKRLKRFNQMTVPELVALSEKSKGEVEYTSIARILGMCSLLGIGIEEESLVLYILFEKCWEEVGKRHEAQIYHFPDGLYKKCLEKVEQWMMEDVENSKEGEGCAKYFWKMSQFAAGCFESYAYPGDYIHRCNREQRQLKVVFAQTLVLLKSVFAKEEFSYEEVQEYAYLYNMISIFVDVCNSFDANMCELLGISEDRHLREDKACLFKPERDTVGHAEVSTKVKDVKAKDAKVEEKRAEITPATSEQTQDGCDYLEEITELRRRLHRKEEEYKYLKIQYEHTKEALKETNILVENYKNDREELIALRSYVYRFSEEDGVLSDENLKDMKDAVAEKNIAIVGGHIKWINKLKKEFPKWKFFDASISRLNDAMILDGTEKLYFFTNHLSHGTYGKYIGLVRENRIPFGYLHSVNLDAVVRQIYRDMVCLKE